MPTGARSEAGRGLSHRANIWASHLHPALPGSEPGLSAALLQSQHPFPLPFLNGSEAVKDPCRRGLAWAVSEHWEVLPIDLGVFNEAFTTAK